MAIKENNHELNVMNVKYKDLKDENRKLSRQLKLLKNKKLEEVNYWDLLL
jgi:cell shape-determining protein MreC